MSDAAGTEEREPSKDGGRRVLAHLPTAISVIAFGFSTVSYYESAMRQADLAVFVPPVIHYGRDSGGDVELFAIPVTITNNGARTGTVLSMDLEVDRLGEVEKDVPRSKRFYSAYLGEHPRNTDTVNRAFAPASIAGRQTYSETIRFSRRQSAAETRAGCRRVSFQARAQSRGTPGRRMVGTPMGAEGRSRRVHFEAAVGIRSAARIPPSEHRDVREGSWSCENDFGSPKGPSDGPWIAQERGVEQFFRHGLGEFECRRAS